MPWHRLADVGTPLSTDGRPYKGLNAYVLGSTCALNAWKSATFGTYRGWQRHGAQVRRGELGTAVILWKPITPGTKNADAEGGDEQHAGRRLIARAFTVFAAEQVDGAEKLLASRSARPERDTVERIVEADRYFAAIGATVIEGGNRAYYSPADDSIHLPELHQFDSAPAAYSTKSHEFSHWSGHPDRLARDLSGRSVATRTRPKNSSPNLPQRCGPLRWESPPRPEPITPRIWRRGSKSCGPTLGHWSRWPARHKLPSTTSTSSPGIRLNPPT